MTVLRAGASIVGYELREDFAERAPSQRGGHVGPRSPYRVEIRDVTEGIEETELDRILLDMPEPHKVVAGAATALRPGGILLAYLPTINQTALLRQALDEDVCPSASRPRRSCGAPGTSRPARSAPTTAWSGAPDSSRRRVDWTADRGLGRGPVHGGHPPRSAPSTTGFTPLSSPSAPTPRWPSPTGCRPTG